MRGYCITHGMVESDDGLCAEPVGHEDDNGNAEDVCGLALSPTSCPTCGSDQYAYRAIDLTTKATCTDRWHDDG